MKPLLCLTDIFVFSCKQKPSIPQNSKAADSTRTISKTALPKSKAGRNKYHTDQDTVYIHTTSEETLTYSREEFNDIIDNFPELYSNDITHPDTTYLNSKIWVDLVDS